METTSPALPPPPAEDTNPATAAFDSLHRPFDPEKFKREFDSLGRWKNRKGNHKRAAAPAPSSPPPAAAVSDPVPGGPPPNFDDVQRALESGDVGQVVRMTDNATAETIVGIIQGLLILAGGVDEGTLSDDEKAMVTRPLVRVLNKYNVGKDVMPEEVDLAIACFTIVFVRLKKPKTATFYEKVKAWGLNWWFGRKGSALAQEMRREASAVQAPPAQ